MATDWHSYKGHIDQATWRPKQPKKKPGTKSSRRRARERAKMQAAKDGGTLPAEQQATGVAENNPGAKS